MDTKNTSKPQKEVSKIKLPNGEIVNIKDAELRRRLDILIGKEKPNTK